MKEVILFGGSFNPIHRGHLALAKAMLEVKEIDELWLLVSPLNPLKEEQAMLSAPLRLALVKEAVVGMKGVKVCDIEFSLPQPSYTYHTLQALEKRYPHIRFSLLVGADNWVNFERWAHWKDILAKHRLWVYPRKGWPLEDLPQGVSRLDAPLFDMSSTKVREAMEKGEEIEKWVPHCVNDWYLKHKR